MRDGRLKIVALPARKEDAVVEDGRADAEEDDEQRGEWRERREVVETQRQPAAPWQLDRVGLRAQPRAGGRECDGANNWLRRPCRANGRLTSSGSGMMVLGAQSMRSRATTTYRMREREIAKSEKRIERITSSTSMPSSSSCTARRTRRAVQVPADVGLEAHHRAPMRVHPLNDHARRRAHLSIVPFGVGLRAAVVGHVSRERVCRRGVQGCTDGDVREWRLGKRRGLLGETRKH
eukprot:7379057-Prymnesium_polylepis.1